LEELDARRDEVKARLERLESSGRQAWRELKGGVDSAMAELEKSVSKALSRFS
jgi:hypothetical protein